MRVTTKTAVCWVIATYDLGSAELSYLATKLSNIITHETGIIK